MKSKIVLSVFLMLMISVFVSGIGQIGEICVSHGDCRNAHATCEITTPAVLGECADYVDAGQACHDSCSVSACIGQVDGKCSTYKCNPYSCDFGPGSLPGNEVCYETCGGEVCWNNGGCATGTSCIGGKDGKCASNPDKGKTCSGSCSKTACIGFKKEIKTCTLGSPEMDEAFKSLMKDGALENRNKPGNLPPSFMEKVRFVLFDEVPYFDGD